MDSNPLFLFDFHEDEDKSEFYLYASANTDLSMINPIREIASKFFDILDQNEVYEDKLNHGVVVDLPMHHRRTLDRYLFDHGINYITTESPGKAPLKDRIEFVAQVIDKMLVE